MDSDWHLRPIGGLPRLLGVIECRVEPAFAEMRCADNCVLSIDGREYRIPVRRVENAMVSDTGLGVFVHSDADGSTLFLIRADASSGEIVDQVVPVAVFDPSCRIEHHAEHLAKQCSLRWHGVANAPYANEQKMIANAHAC